MTLNHRVIAVVGSAIQRVQCLTCGGDHKYYPPKGQKEADHQKQERRTSTTEKARKPSVKSPSRAEGEWATFMKDMTPEIIPRPYKVSETFLAGEYIEHPMFGTGRVIDIVGAEKIQVIFKEGRKVLLFNRKN
jgi:hypothetical protein